MAHFARIEDGLVVEVLAVANEALDPADEEGSGLALLAASGIEGQFVQCSYNGTMRGCYPGEGSQWIPNDKHKDGGEFVACIGTEVPNVK